MNIDILKKIAQEVVKFKDQGNTTTNIVKVQRPEGARFYKGTSVGPGSMFRKNQATFNAVLKSQNDPSNSVTTKQVEQFRGDKKIMEKNASVLGWLRGALKLRGANKQVGEAIQKGLKYEKAISPNLKKSIATEYTGALKNVHSAQQTMKQESAGMFGAKQFIENTKANIAQKFVKPVIKKGPGRPTVDPKLKKSAPKQTAGRVSKTGVTPESGMPEPINGTPLSKKYPLKGMAIAGAGGYVGGKFLQSGSDNEYEYPKYGSVGSSVSKLLKGVSKAIKDKYVLGAGAVGLGTGLTTGAILDDGHDKSDHGRKKTAGVKTILKGINKAFETVGKKLPTQGTVKVRGLVIQPKGRNIVKTVDTKVNIALSKLEAASKKGTSATIGLGKKNTRVHIVKRDVPKELRRINNELKQRNTRAGKLVVGTGALGIAGSGYLLSKKAEDMSPKEKADQKYAIAKSYENEGHPRKADEYKNKASKAYKRAYEKRAAKIGDSLTRDILQGVAAGLAGGVAGVVSSVTVAKLLDNSKENKALKEELLNKDK